MAASRMWHAWVKKQTQSNGARCSPAWLQMSSAALKNLKWTNEKRLLLQLLPGETHVPLSATEWRMLPGIKGQGSGKCFLQSSPSAQHTMTHSCVGGRETLTAGRGRRRQHAEWRWGGICFNSPTFTVSASDGAHVRHMKAGIFHTLCCDRRCLDVHVGMTLLDRELSPPD